MCVQCVSTGATAIPAALAVLGGMVWKHRRDEAQQMEADGAHEVSSVNDRGQMRGPSTSE